MHLAPADLSEEAHVLAALHAEAQRAGWSAVEKARRCGDFIRRFPRGPRGRLLQAAGVPARTASLYVHVAEHWPEIQEQFAQRDALSLRGLIAGTRKTEPARMATVVYTASLDAVEPAVLATVLWPFRGREATVTIRLKAKRVPPDPRQLTLF
jgi:hypothetical protein